MLNMSIIVTIYTDRDGKAEGFISCHSAAGNTYRPCAAELARRVITTAVRAGNRVQWDRHDIDTICETKVEIAQVSW